MAGYDHGETLMLHGFFQVVGELRLVVGVAFADEFNSEFLQYLEQRQPFPYLPVAGAGLVAGHGRGPVVQEHQRDIAVAPGRVHQAGHPGVEEGGVADESHYFAA